MNASIKIALSNQANHELLAAHAYLAMAMWCDSNDYKGFAKFFYQQADEEKEHAEKFFKHLLDRGELPELTSIETPRTSFDGLRDIAEFAQVLERRNSENIHSCYQLAQEIHDFPSVPMLLEFIDEQIEEEAWAETMITLTRRAECPGALYNLDRHIIGDLSDE